MIRNGATFLRRESGCARNRTDAPFGRPESFQRTNPPPVESPIAGVRPLPPARGIGQGNQRLESRHVRIPSINRASKARLSTRERERPATTVCARRFFPRDNQSRGGE